MTAAMAKRQNRPCAPRMPSIPQAIHASNRGVTMYIASQKLIRNTQNICAFLLASATLTTFPAPVSAQQLFFPWAPATATQTAGTVTVGGTFQTILAANTGRKGCLIQNTSTHTMSIYVGTLADATAAKSIQVAASGGSFACNLGPIVLTGDVNATTSTNGDAFVVLSAQ